MSKPSFWSCFQSYRKFQKLSSEKKRIVFYSEGKSYWNFLRPYVKALIETTDKSFTYVSSEADDPGLTYCPERMTGLCVGSGLMMIMWFNSLQADVLAMSTPDLETFHVKRSKTYPVHYAYLMHGSDSVFMVLREQALDHFDSVFCAGPHNIIEIRKREALKHLPEKELFEIGYGYQDELIQQVEKANLHSSQNTPLNVLVAPSWSENGTGTLEVCGIELIGSLLNAGFETVLRPHPRTVQIHPQVIEKIRQAFSHHKNFILDVSPDGAASLMKADLLVSDWSAIALEYAFSRLRPVLYIDVPPKAINPNYQELGLVPFEVSVREKIGAVLRPQDVAQAGEWVRKLCEDPLKRTEQIKNVRNENVFNVGNSAVKGAETLVMLSQRRKKSNAQ